MPVRTIKATYSSLTGKFASRKMNRLISWESALERDFYYLLENDTAVETIEEQPITFIGNRIKYTPDTYIVLTKRSLFFPKLRIGKNIIEIKYRSDLHRKWAKYKPKFRLAVHECKKNNLKFKILTDIEIRTKLLDNIKHIEHHMRRESDTENEMRELVISELSAFGICDIDSLLNSCFRNRMNQLKVMPVLWRLIGDQSVGVDLHKPIGRKSDIWIMK